MFLATYVFSQSSLSHW